MDEAGGTVIVAAAMFPVLIGAMGLGAETGYWYLEQRKVQYAADVAAHAAALRKRSGDAQEKITLAARDVATKAGIPSTAALLAETPAAGTFAGQPNAIQVTITEELPRLFTSFFAAGTVKVSGKAVARFNGGSKVCVLALSKTASAAVNVTGSGAMTLSGCDIASNSTAADSFSLQGGSASVTTDCLYTVGQAAATTRLTLNVCDEPVEYAPAVLDPYEAVPAPNYTGSGNCVENNKNVGRENNVGEPDTLPSSGANCTMVDASGLTTPVLRFTNGLTVKGNLEFAPGIYIIEGGDFTINAGAIVTVKDQPSLTSPYGVTFVLRNGASAKFNGDATIQLFAPTVGTYAGILFYAKESGVSHRINGGAGSTFEGAIYTPKSALEFRGNATLSEGCTQIIADTVTVSGASNVGSSCPENTKTAFANQAVQVVE